MARFRKEISQDELKKNIKPKDQEKNETTYQASRGGFFPRTNGKPKA